MPFGAFHGAASPVWVKLRGHGRAMARPVYLQQRTYLVTASAAVECQIRTLALQ